MTTLQDIFDLLASGEFANMAIGRSVTNSITAENYPKIVNNMNLGLIELYKRFQLRKKEIYLYQQENVTEYYIRSDYVTSANYTGDDAYLVEATDEEFEDDIIKMSDIEC